MKLNHLLFVFLVISSHLLGQKTTQTRDEFGIQSSMVAIGAWNDTVLPANGTFDYKWRELNDGQMTIYYVKGQTKNHLAIGNWTWEVASWDHQYNVGKGVLPSISSKGKRSKWIGNYVNGEPNGKWIYTQDSVQQDGSIFLKLARYEFTYLNGKIAGKFKMESLSTGSKFQVNGQTDQNGLATGTWNYQLNPLAGGTEKEIRSYKQGLILNVEKTFLDGTIYKKKYQDNNQYFVTDGNIVTNFTLGEIPFEQDEHGGILSELMHEGLKNHLTNNWKLDAFPLALNLAIPLFKRLNHSLTPTQLAKRDSIHEALKIQQQTTEDLYSQSSELYRANFLSLDSLLSLVTIVKHRNNLVDSMLKRFEIPYFTYQNLDMVQFKDLHRQFQIHSKSTALYHPTLELQLETVELHDDMHLLTYLDNEISMTDNLLQSLQKELSTTNFKIKQQTELRALEDELTQKLSAQISFYNNGDGIKAIIYQKWLQKTIPVSIQQYIQTEDYTTALQLGTQINGQLDTLQKWQSSVDLIDNFPSLFNTSYTLMAYNPYTGNNDIPMKIKKRFATSIEALLIPYYTDQLKEDKDWKSWKIQMENKIGVYTFLLAFAAQDDTDSKRIERHVRKEKKAERMVRYLENEVQKSIKNLP